MGSKKRGMIQILHDAAGCGVQSHTEKAVGSNWNSLLHWMLQQLAGNKAPPRYNPVQILKRSISSEVNSLKQEKLVPAALLTMPSFAGIFLSALVYRSSILPAVCKVSSVAAPRRMPSGPPPPSHLKAVSPSILCASRSRFSSSLRPIISLVSYLCGNAVRAGAA